MSLPFCFFDHEHYRNLSLGQTRVEKVVILVASEAAWETWMENVNDDGNAAREAMTKTLEDLVPWAIERRWDDSFREKIVKLELERRVAVAQIKTAKWMLRSVIVLVVVGVVNATFQWLTWMWPHIPK